MTFQPVTYLSELFMEVAVKSMLSLHFGDYTQYRHAKLMFCTITKLYTLCYTFFPVPVNYEKEVKILLSVSSNIFLFGLTLSLRPGSL